MNNKKPTAGIILAAGESRRFGSSKQMEKLNGKPILNWVLEASLNSDLDKTILVLGHDHEKILPRLNHLQDNTKLQIEINPAYNEGMSSSLRLGLSKTMEDFPAAMFILGDQPMITVRLINLLLGKFAENEMGICVPSFKGKRKNPVIMSKKYYKELMDIRGDKGARKIIDSNLQDVLFVEIDDNMAFIDVDTKEDLERLKGNL